MVVEDHLGLDGRIVPDRQGAFGFSVAQRRASLRDPLTLWFVTQAFGPFKP